MEYIDEVALKAPMVRAHLLSFLLHFASSLSAQRYTTLADLLNSEHPHPMFAHREHPFARFFDDDQTPTIRGKKPTLPPSPPPTPYKPAVDARGEVSVFVALAGCPTSALKHGSCFQLHGHAWNFGMFMRLPSSAKLSAVRTKVGTN